MDEETMSLMQRALDYELNGEYKEALDATILALQSCSSDMFPILETKIKTLQVDSDKLIKM
jgi:hypothetical protein